MIIRITEIAVKPERLKDFLHEYDVVRASFLASPGCLRIRLLQDKEDEHSFSMLMEWASEEDKAAFTQNGMTSWRGTISEIVAKPNIYRYFNEI